MTAKIDPEDNPYEARYLGFMLSRSVIMRAFANKNWRFGRCEQG
jgi:hypothetical protein